MLPIIVHVVILLSHLPLCAFVDSKMKRASHALHIFIWYRVIRQCSRLQNTEQQEQTRSDSAIAKTTSCKQEKDFEKRALIPAK